MRLLLDECVDQRLRYFFPEHECHTAAFANLAGLKNGRLLDAAEASGFDVLITVDQQIPSQQNLKHRTISIIVMCGPTNRLDDLKSLVPAVYAALPAIGPGDVVRIGGASG
jgi:hypothetical protein